MALLAHPLCVDGCTLDCDITMAGVSLSQLVQVDIWSIMALLAHPLCVDGCTLDCDITMAGVSLSDN